MRRRARPRLLLFGPLPRRGSAVGGTQVSFGELVARFETSGAFEVDVVDTTRPHAHARGARRVLAAARALLGVVAALLRRAPQSDAVMLNVSAGALLSAGPLLGLLCRALRRPLAVRVFGGDLDLCLARAPAWKRRLAEATVLRAPLVLLQTQALCRRFESRARVRWLPTTRDLQWPAARRSGGCTRFLLLGQLRPEKGVGEALLAIARLPEGCTLTVCGPAMPGLDPASLQGRSRVEWRPAIEPSQVPALLAEHDALVFPSTFEGEGHPGAVIEALQAGLPVIASRWRALPEVVEDGVCGLLVAPRSVDELASAMKSLAQDRELFQRLRAGALERGERFRSGPGHDRLEGWLRELCGRREEHAGARVLFLSDNFPPETNAPATRTFEHAREWVRAGARVTVITCAPNFPEGRLMRGYENRWCARETVEGVEVVRVKTFISANKGFALRVLDHLSFMAAATLAGLFQPRPDVVVATSPQFFAAVGGWLVSVLRRAPFVLEVRDLWPESIAAVGALRDGPLLRALERLELFLYRRARAVVVVTEAFRANLAARGIPAEKVAVVRNGVDLSRYAPRPRDAGYARRAGVEGKFVVGYLGTHGMAHALQRVLEAAELLRARPDVAFLFVGAGAAREDLARRAGELALSNVRFLEAQPKEAMPALWSLCDLSLVHLRKAELFSTVIPSKIFECMGMGVPILYAGPAGEAASIVRETGSGVAVPPEDPRALAEAVVRLADDRAALSACARAARAAAPRFDRQALAARMLAILLDCGPRIPRAVAESAPLPAPAAAEAVAELTSVPS